MSQIEGPDLSKHFTTQYVVFSATHPGQWNRRGSWESQQNAFNEARKLVSSSTSKYTQVVCVPGDRAVPISGIFQCVVHEEPK